MIKIERIMPTNEEISELVSSILGQRITEIKSVKPGVQGKVFELAAAGKNYVFKTSEQNYDLENKVIEILAKEGIPVPKVIATNADVPGKSFNFSLMEKIEGRCLEDIPKDQWPDVLNEVGLALNRIHHISTKQYGSINYSKLKQNGVLVGEYASWLDYLKEYVLPDAKAFKTKVESEKANGFKGSKLNEEQIEAILEIVGKLDQVEMRLAEGISDFSFEPKLLYRDLHSQHIFVKDGKLAGLIDFGAVASGDPLFDISYFSVMPSGDFYSSLVEGWNGEFNDKRFHLYRLLISSEKLHTRYVEHDYLDKYPEIIDYALEELQR